MGGGFCEKHGPYDPPHTTCPFCAREEAQRRAYGPPSSAEMTRPSSKSIPPVPDQPDEPEFVRRTVEHQSEEPADEAVADNAADSAESGDDMEARDPSPPTKDDVTQVAPSQFLDENVVEVDGEPSWIEQEPEPLGWLVVKWPAKQRGEMLPVRPNQIIGRQGDIRWPDPLLSRQHARFTFEPAEDAPDEGPVFHLWPFGPTNPVAVNGEMIRGATPVYENDEIHLGDTLFVFKTLLD